MGSTQGMDGGTVYLETCVTPRVEYIDGGILS